MNSVLDKIKKEIRSVLANAGVKATEDDIVIPPDENMGDFSFPCFRLAKEQGKNPADLAVEIIEKMGAIKDIFNKIENSGPYINFFINTNKLAKLTVDFIEKTQALYGRCDIGNNKKIMLEFSQPNTHKEFHIGHSRGTLLGQSLVNILKASGYHPIAANYIGDTGAHVSKWLWAFEQFHKNKAPKDRSALFLNNVYQEAVAKLEEDEKFKEEVAEIQLNFEKKNPALMKIWEMTKEWSMDEFRKIYKMLGVSFDIYYYESDQEADGKRLVKKMMKQGLAKKSEGAIVVDLEKYNLGIFLVLRSDGTALYATKDLALAFKKFKKYKLAESWYLVDTRQKLFMKQVFATLELLGFKKPIRHIAYEFVSTPEGVISSRKGGIVSFINFYNHIFNLARTSTAERHDDWSDEKINEAARIIAMGAIKFDMLKTSREHEIIFDPNDALAFEGFTGPYILYTLARINSILKKDKVKKFKKWKNIRIERTEKRLVLKLLMYPDIVAEAAKEAEPAIISQYLFDLAQRFAEFYHVINILKAKDTEKAWRLALIKNIKQVLENGLGLLGIEHIQEM